jgi:predicted lipoprotein with Yx(FWY)xxD motif
VIREAAVARLGQVLVNREGRTLYLLTSEKGGRLLCTAATGCTVLWPVVSLSAGVPQSALGPGVSRQLLGTVPRAGGVMQLTYAGWPLYTYAGDTGPGQATGEGLPQFNGIWEAVSPQGQPVRAH